MAVIAIITTILVGDQPLRAVAVSEISMTLRICFIVFAILCIIGIFASLNRRGTKSANGDQSAPDTQDARGEDGEAI